MNCKRNTPCSAIIGPICPYTTCAHHIKAKMPDRNEIRLSYPEPIFKENCKRPPTKFKITYSGDSAGGKWMAEREQDDTSKREALPKGSCRMIYKGDSWVRESDENADIAKRDLFPNSNRNKAEQGDDD